MPRVLKTLLLKALGRRRIQGVRALLRTSTIHGQFPLVRTPEGGRITVLAPHMDDEVLGCGGTIARHAQAGAQVSVIFLTDGRRGSAAIAALPDTARARGEEELIEIRKQEARRAGAILGVRHMLFLDAEDGRLSTDSRTSRKLAAIIERDPPDIVYLPFFLESHPDHRAASAMLVAATQGTALDFECRGYEVWTPLFPNLVVEIDAAIELKKQALACYPSQLADMDYVHMGIGLNAYRASAVGGKSARFVEAFYALALADYRQMYRSVRKFL